jgi:hypothetical protein
MLKRPEGGAMTVLIAYDLNRPGQNYDALIKELKSIGSYARPLESTWLINTTHTPAAIRDYLKDFIDAGDKLLVVALAGDWATYGIHTDVVTWLKNSIQ